MEDLLKDLNLEQKAAVTHGDGPLLIIAGAGTGKTTVITKRIAWLIAEGKAKPENLLALTFTEKAAGEMEERVDRLLPYGYVDLWISTFHAFCERILKAHALDIGLSTDFKLLNSTAQWLLVREHLDRFTLDYYKPLGNPTKFIHALLTHFSRAKDEVVSPREYLAYAEGLALDKDAKDQAEEKNRLLEVANAYHTYEQILLENNALDFGSLINYTLKLFRERPALLERYRKQFKYVLVDEFQDTNWAQYELVKLLAAPANNLTVVGDDDQSIYKFRGASISNILQFEKDYKKTKRVVLVKNYRSSQNILDLSYAFIQANNPNRLEAAEHIIKKLESGTKEKGEIEHLHAADLRGEVRMTLQKIVDLKRGDTETNWNDFAILVRANDSAMPFTTALQRSGIPYQFMALKGLYTKPIILDAVNYFKLLDNYHESTAMYRMLNLPFLRIPSEDLHVLTHEAKRKTQSLYEVCRRAKTLPTLHQETLAAIDRLLSLIETHTAFARKKHPSELYLHFFKDTGYLEYLNEASAAPDEEQKRREAISYLGQFYKKIIEFEHEFPDPSLKEFINLLKVEMESGEEGALTFDPDSGPDMVRVMTIHAAKGLEFRYVFITGLVDRRFPTSERGDAIEFPAPLIKETLPEGDAHLEEERRLMYVAMTRAKRGLYFTSADDYGGARKKKPSRFLAELGFAENEASKDASENFSEEKPTESVSPSTFEIPLPKKFSFTQLAAFSSCPLQYKFAHLLKIPVFGKPSFSFGKSMHATLQKFFNAHLERAGAKQGDLFSSGGASDKAEFPTLEELLRFFEESWVDEWYRSKTEREKYRELGKKSLRIFYKQIAEHPPKTLGVEKGFHVKLGKYTLKGQIDRVDAFEDGVEIIDYKTGSSKEKLNADDKRQLFLYHIACERALGLKPKKLTFYYLNDNTSLSFEAKEKELARFEEDMIRTIDEMHGNDFEATPGNPVPCKFCDFKDICEFKAPGA